jgi:hypothetical protein
MGRESMNLRGQVFELGSTGALLLQRQHLSESLACRFEPPRCKGGRVRLDAYDTEHAQRRPVQLELIVCHQRPVVAHLTESSGLGHRNERVAVPQALDA